MTNIIAIVAVMQTFSMPIRRRVPEYERFFAVAFTRGYVLASLWSPGAVILYLILQATGFSCDLPAWRCPA